MIEFDLILDKVGHCGRYQILLILLAYWLDIPSAMHNVSPVFYGASVKFRCNVPPLDDPLDYPNLTQLSILNYTTPNYEGNFDTCKRYGYNLSACQPPSLGCVDMEARAIDCDHGYKYDTSQFTLTVNTQWNLVCDRKILGTIATSIYFAGMWAGAIVFGYLADYIGRRNTMLVSSIGCLISGVSTAFTPWFELFVVLRFFTAAFSHGSVLILFVYVIEITGKKRTLTGVHTHTAFAIGYSLNSLVSYFLRDWRYFYFAISLTPLPFLVFYFILPDSPRWHFSNGRDKIGIKMSEKFARYNRKSLTKCDWKNAEVTETKPELLNKSYSYIDLFRTTRMRLITLNCMFSWLVISLVYYGLSLNAGSLAGNIFINNAINGAIELISILFIQFTMDRWGRKFLLIFFMILQGTACLLSTIFTEVANGNQVLVTIGVVFSFIGKIGVGGSYTVIYNYTAELFPTVIRGNAMGMAAMAAKVGTIACPFILLLQDYVSWLPSTLLGVLSVAAGILATFFPETMNRTLPQTIDEAEILYKGNIHQENHNDASKMLQHGAYEDIAMNSQVT